MRTNNTKVNRTLSALAIVLKDLPDNKIDEIHKVINDERDGYTFDFKLEVDKMRAFVK